MTKFIRFKSCTAALIAVLIAACYCFNAQALDLDGQLSRTAGQATSLFADPQPGDGGNYAPDRRVDIVHLSLDVTPDFQKRTIKGKVVFTFKPIALPLDELRLDAVDLKVSEVNSTATISGYQSTGKELVVSFAEPIKAGQENSLTISYSAQPVKGLYFRAPSNGYSAADMHMYTQGEMIEARHWFPCYDYPNAKFTSEVTCRVPEGMTVISNGRQVLSQKDPADGLLAVRWLQDKPHVNYLITLVAGYFSRLEDKYKDIPLSFYTLPSDAGEAALAFAYTRPAMEFYEKEIGIDYPWDKYGQVVVRDYEEGGMENTSLTTLSDIILRRTETETVRSPLLEEYTAEKIIVHELAHQWFGDLITCKDWSHAWLNEGFATYYSLLYLGHRYGHEQMLNDLYEDLQAIIQQKEEARPIVYRRYHTPWEQFDQRAYARASWVLHMLRSQLGDELFGRCARTFLERHRYGTVVSSDLNKIVEELSGRSFDRFFDQWIYESGMPDLTVKYSWDEKARLAKLSVSQKKAEESEGSRSSYQREPAAGQARVFHFPLTFAFKTKNETVERQVQVKQAEETFYFPLKKAPEIVRFDPHLSLLADVNFEQPEGMLYAQLADQSDLVGRLVACDSLSARKDDYTVGRLKSVLQNDRFYGVRVRAAASLRKIHSDEALEALAASTKQSDSRARNAVVQAIAGFYHPRAREALSAVLADEKNPEIIASALKGLGSYHEARLHDLLLKYLSTVSYRDIVANGAIEAIRSLDDPTFVAPLRGVLSKRENDMTSFVLGRGLDTLAYIDRNEKPRDDVRNFIAGYLNHKRERISLSAMKALGTLEDPKSIALLQTFAASAKDTPQQKQAEWSIISLRSVNKPNDNLQDLRQEVLDLQKSNRDIKKDFDDLKARLTAVEAKKKSEKKPAPAKTKTTKKAKTNSSSNAAVSQTAENENRAAPQSESSGKSSDNKNP
jgi:aminopeptidase N